MLNIRTNGGALVVEEVGKQTHLIFRNEVSYRITNPDILVIYKVNDPNKIFLQEQIQNITIDSIQLTKTNAIELSAATFTGSTSGGGGGGSTGTLKMNQIDLSDSLDGVTQTFTIPSNLSNYMIFFNGLLQTKDKNYTISGTTLTTTFVDPPEIGEELLIIYFTLS